MLKSEFVFLEILKGTKTQKQIAETLNISLSTVNHALESLTRMGAIEKRNFGFKLLDSEKVLMHWANVRNLKKDIVYKTKVESTVTEIEKNMPSGILFTAFTAFKLRFKEVPADYSEVYIYADREELAEIKKRFPEKKGPANLIVFQKEELLKEKKLAPNELLWVDLWNLKEWYAKEFLKALRQKMDLDL